MSHDLLALVHIYERTKRIQAYTNGLGEAEFVGTPLIQDAVLLNLESLAETTRHLSPDFRANHPEFCWDCIYGVRVLLMYDCLGIDPALVWNTVNNDIPTLKARVAEILLELGYIPSNPEREYRQSVERPNGT